MTTKKVFVELVELLETTKLPKKIMAQVYELTRAKVNNKTFHLVDGETKIVFCYYHKVWEVVSDNPYGIKASSASGLNSMCKAGVSLWTKQQRVLKNQKDKLLLDLAKGDIEREDIHSLMEELKEESKTIVINDDGYDSLEEAINSL